MGPRLRTPAVVDGGSGRWWRVKELANLDPVATPARCLHDIDVDCHVEKWAPPRKGKPGRWRKITPSCSGRNRGRRCDLTLSLTGFQETKTLLFARFVFWALRTRGTKDAEGYLAWAEKLDWASQEVDHINERWWDTTLANLRVRATGANRA